MGRLSRSLILAALLPCACTEAPIVTPDATRYEARDAIVDPRPDSSFDALSLADNPPTVDVTAFDGPAASDASTDGGLDVPVTCQDLATLYLENVQAAQACASPATCNTLACETPCCDCQVYLQSGTVAYQRLDDLRTQWTAMGCVTSVGCPSSACETPVAAACSSLGRCVTVRAVGDGGL